MQIVKYHNDSVPERVRWVAMASTAAPDEMTYSDMLPVFFFASEESEVAAKADRFFSIVGGDFFRSFGESRVVFPCERLKTPCGEEYWLAYVYAHVSNKSYSSWSRLFNVFKGRTYDEARDRAESFWRDFEQARNKGEV